MDKHDLEMAYRWLRESYEGNFSIEARILDIVDAGYDFNVFYRKKNVFAQAEKTDRSKTFTSFNVGCKRIETVYECLVQAFEYEIAQAGIVAKEANNK